MLRFGISVTTLLFFEIGINTKLRITEETLLGECLGSTLGNHSQVCCF